MCCGYPMRGNGMPIENSRIVTDNKVIFHRMANTLNYLDVKTILISCGTCMKQLKDYHLEEIFPGSSLISTSTSQRKASMSEAPTEPGTCTTLRATTRCP